jgi:hypothetical protein
MEFQRHCLAPGRFRKSEKSRDDSRLSRLDSLRHGPAVPDEI